MDSTEMKAINRKHVMFPWTANANVDPMVIRDAEGVYIIDDSGRQILDFSAQLKCVNAGHKNKRIIKAIQEQAERLCYVSPGFAQEPRTRLAKMLAEVVPGDLNKFFFANGGTEANENVIKMARAFTQKQKIITLYRSYHGATLGASSLTGDIRRTMAEPGIPGIVHALNPYCYRCPFGLEHPQCNLRCAEHIGEVIQYENPETVAAFMLEPVAGAGGIIIPPDGYLQRVREICDANEVLLIADEIMTGFGRTGKWFAVEHWGVVPDLMTMAKGINSAYLPLSAVALSDKVSKVLDQEVLYCGLTYSGHPVSCAAAVATIEAYREEKMIENARVLGRVLGAELEKLKEKHACVGDVRYIGLFSCLELVRDQKTKEPIDPKKYAKEIFHLMLNKGLFSNIAAIQEAIYLCVAPPLCINETELREGLQIIDEVLDYADTLTK
jgi:taurine--2-oxoglutarate transaminase